MGQREDGEWEDLWVDWPREGSVAESGTWTKS